MTDVKLPIYLDYSATTPIDARVADKMAQYLTLEGKFGNPASRSHEFGWKAEKAVDDARQQVADLINADPREIIWTSGATESDNLAIKGAAHFYQKKGKHIITIKTEHKAVLDTCRQLEREGFDFYVLEGASYHDEFGYDDELTKIASERPDVVTFVPTVSRPHEPRNEGWTGEKGRVNTIVEKYIAKFGLAPEDTRVYACGHPQMIEDVKARVKALDFPFEEERFWKVT